MTAGYPLPYMPEYYAIIIVYKLIVTLNKSISKCIATFNMIMLQFTSILLYRNVMRKKLVLQCKKMLKMKNKFRENNIKKKFLGKIC